MNGSFPFRQQFGIHFLRVGQIYHRRNRRQDPHHRTLNRLVHIPSVKGIVSRKFDMLFWCRWIDKYFLHLFILSVFLNIIVFI
jgi:hypothetical protein